MFWRVLAFGIATVGGVGLGGLAWPDEQSPGNARPNWELPTLGGLQYWADERVCGPYRIQRHVSTGHYRLLDDSDTRHAWGRYEDCEVALDKLCPPESRPRFSRRVVLVLHGLGRSRHSMEDLADYLREHGADDVIPIGYASTREDVRAHAQSLDRVVRRLDGVQELDIVAYSMGNIVARYWLGELAAAATATPPAADAKRPRLRRYVMLGPPNHGAERANLWAKSALERELFDRVLGDSGWQLGPRFHEIEARLATPACEFGIIAGGRGTRDGWHMEIPGDDDGTVGVEETKLAGAADFAVIPVRHMGLITDERALRMTATFLRRGYFESVAARAPIPRPGAANDGQVAMPPPPHGASPPRQSRCPPAQPGWQ